MVIAVKQSYITMRNEDGTQYWVRENCWTFAKTEATMDATELDLDSIKARMEESQRVNGFLGIYNPKLHIKD